MKTEQILVFISLVTFALSGPARRDCGQLKSFTATNECGVTYGGTWTECVTGVFDIQTFTVPACTMSASAGIPMSLNATITSIEPVITSAPEPQYPTESSTGGSTCSELWICVDAIAVCGTETAGYGACYDACTSTSLTPPPCTLPSVTSAPTSTLYVSSTTDVIQTPPPREHKDICDEKPYMCAPKGW